METVQRRSLSLLWNNSSGWSDPDRIRSAVQSFLRDSGLRVGIHQVEKGMDILEESRSILAGGADVLVAAGGDGTINAAASALVHQSTALGVIPSGTLNHFARDLQIPLEPEKAAEVLVDGRLIRVDAGAVNGRVFINNSVLGLFPNYRRVRALGTSGLWWFSSGSFYRVCSGSAEGLLAFASHDALVQSQWTAAYLA